MKQYPSQERLKELFDYHPDGYLIRKKGKLGIIGSRRVEGTTVRHKVYLKRIAYKYIDLLYIYFFGSIPEDKFVKTKSGAFLTALPSDLYLVDSCFLKNAGNVNTKNKHKYKGVKMQASGNYQALMDGEDLGTYTNIKAAASAYDAAALLKYGKGVTVNDSGCENPEDYKVNRDFKNYSVKKSKHKYKGVMPNRKNWMARIVIDKKAIYCGTYKSEIEAARAYNIAAYEHYGEHAVLNDIPDPLGKGDAF